MKAKRTAITIAAAILVWINILTVLLSAYRYGYVDWVVVGQMGFLSFPPLAVAAVLTLRGVRQTAKAANRGAAAGLGDFRTTAAAGR